MLRVTFSIIMPVPRSKGTTVFCKLELHFLRQETLLKIWLNPGLNLTIFRGTGPSCYLAVLSFVLFFGSEEYNGEHRVPKKEL